METLLRGVERLLAIRRNYGNPLEVWIRRRRPGSDGEMRVVDRRTGVVCLCRAEAHRMFGEVWFDRDYDVPGVSLQPGDVVLDLGGNQGFYACYAAAQGCRVLSFEPDPENVRLLERNLQANGFTSLVQVIPAAVKAASGDVRLFRTDQLGGGMNTTMPHFAEQFGFHDSDSLLVSGVSLPDTLSAEKIERIRICKMDCEGAELEIVQSLTADEMNRIDAFAIEYHREAYAPTALVTALERWGTHHVFPAAAKSYCQRDILYAVSRKIFEEILCPSGGRA